MNCAERESIEQEVSAALSAVTELMKRQLEALKVADHHKMFALDRELENSFGRKERAFGALRQHRKDHGC
jgi:hypothetical protein